MKYLLIILFLTIPVFSETTIEPEVLKSKPIALDGTWDSGWSDVKKVYKVTRIGFESIISIRAMIHHDTIYFLFEWDDKTLNSQHKPWIWDDKKRMYVVGDKREDRFIVRWGINIDSERINSTNDVWYWGSVRANQGRADDRYEILSKNPIQRGLKNKDFENKEYFFKSQGDVGKRCWITEYQKRAFWLDKSRYKPEILQRGTDDFEIPRGPTLKGSREDVQAFAVWKKGTWTMEVARKLSTGNFDDVEFNWGQEYFFDISKELYKDAHIVHNISLLKDDAKTSEQFPLKLKMPVKPLQEIIPKKIEKGLNEKD